MYTVILYASILITSLTFYFFMMDEDGEDIVLGALIGILIGFFIVAITSVNIDKDIRTVTTKYEIADVRTLGAKDIITSYYDRYGNYKYLVYYIDSLQYMHYIKIDPQSVNIQINRRDTTQSSYILVTEYVDTEKGSSNWTFADVPNPKFQIFLTGD